MNTEERAQLIEDIDRSGTMRKRIAEQARLNPDFDVAMAFRELAELDTSVANRLLESLSSTE